MKTYPSSIIPQNNLAQLIDIFTTINAIRNISMVNEGLFWNSTIPRNFILSVLTKQTK